jgi:hypothetical protein
MTVGFLHGQSAYENGPIAPLESLGAILVRFSR